MKPEERLSFVVSSLPFLEQAALYEQVEITEGWKSDKNETLATTEIPSLLNPGLPIEYEKYPPSHYVGIAGIGKDAPTLKLPHKRAGVFGYERRTRFRDITDGTSNTMMMSEASGKFGSWAAGGKPTLRSLTKKPYINGPDGIGGPYPGGCNVLMSDGSVRFVSEQVDPTLFEAMSTIAGGETVRGIP